MAEATAVREQLAPSSGGGPPARPRRGVTIFWHAAFFALAYVPVLRMHPGEIEADTKSYLYLDPARFLKRAVSLWDPHIAMGTLSHQTIGYLFPMGPYYLLLHELGVPAWVSQRLWLGTLVLLAGYGMRYMLRTLGVEGAGIGVAMIAYAFTPYVLGYTSIYSALLLPWAALPWWIGYAERALRGDGSDPAAWKFDAWKYAALFALTVQLAGSVNGSSLVFALLGPLLWIVHAAIFRPDTRARAWAVTWRAALLTIVTSLWWFWPLLIEGKYGVNILRFTESTQAVATTSQPYEVLRGLGNWYFYGTDRLGAWVDARPFYTQRVDFVFVSYVVPALALLGAAVLRWKHRAYFIGLLFLAVIIAVGAEPYDHPSILGAIYKNLALHRNIVFAFRNVGRVMPLLTVSVAAILGVAVSAFARRMRDVRRPVIGLAASGIVLAVCLVNAVPALGGHYYSKYLEYSKVPSYWRQAIAYMDAQPHDTRVLALPGSDFASYRWGDTRDPIEPGLMDRPYAARELVAYGTAPTINLLRSLDHRVQEGALDPAALAPMAKLMGVGDVEVRSDLEGDRYSLVPAGELWRTIGDPTAPGLDPPKKFGKTTASNSLVYSEFGDLTIPKSQQPVPPAVAVMPVKNPLPIVRSEPASAAMLVDGDGEGVVDVASAGLLDPSRLLLYSAPYLNDPQQLRSLAAGSKAELVVTDSNRKRGQRWSGLHDNFGYTEQAGEKPLAEDPLDQRLDPFEQFGTSDATRTTTVLSGAKSVRATTYGEPVFAYSPGERPAAAFDGDVRTSWTVDNGQTVGHERLVLTLDHPITTDHVNLVQFTGRQRQTDPLPNRLVSQVSLLFDGKHEVKATVTGKSLYDKGQTIQFPKQHFSTLELVIDKVSGKHSILYPSMNPVGFSEIRVADDAKGAKPVRIAESAQLPSDLLQGLGSASATHPLMYVLSRDSTMDGAAMNRRFYLPTARSFSFTGTGHVSAVATDGAIDGLFGFPDASVPGGLTATSDERLGAPTTRASSALDGDARTSWQTPVGAPADSLTFSVHDPITFDHLALTLVADGRHSLPLSLDIKADKGPTRTVNLTLPKANSTPLGLMNVNVKFPAITGKRFRVTVENVRQVYYANSIMPVGIAELGVPGVKRAASPSFIPNTCYDNIVTLDGTPLPVKFAGLTETALKQKPLPMTLCDPKQVLQLGAGYHDLRITMSPHNPTGFDVNRVVLASNAHDAAAAPTALTAATSPPPSTHVVHSDNTSMTVRIDHATQPFWFVLGQSYSSGWTATVNGHSLGTPQLVNGFANGWRISPTTGSMTLHVVWAPEKSVRLALVASSIGGLACLAILLLALARRRRNRALALEPLAVVGWPHPARLVGRRAQWVALGVGVIGALVVRPWVGLLVGLVTLAAARWPVVRWAMRFAPFLLTAGVAVYVPLEQYFHRYPPRFNWSAFFSAATIPAWIAVLLLLADVMLHVAGPADSDTGTASGTGTEDQRDAAGEGVTP